MSQKSYRCILIGIYLTSCAALVFEISLTRIFSVSLWYHFAFMVVSIALLGYGASGSFLMIAPQIKETDIAKYLFYLSILFSISIPVSYVVANKIPFDPVKISWDIHQLYFIFFYYLIYALPFFFAGLIISIALANLSGKSHTIYFFDLIGAATGSILALFVFSLFGEGGVFVGSFIGMLGAVFFQFSCQSKVKMGIIALLIFSLTVLLIQQPDFVKLRISPYKGLKVALQYPGARLVKSKWNSFSRLDVVKSPAIRFAPGLSLKYLGLLPEQVGFAIDGGNLTAITKYSGNREILKFIDFLPASAPYYLKKDLKNVLVLEPGGGLDILSALHYQLTDIKVIERNRLVYNLIKKDYADFSGNIYSKKEVSVEIGEGRNLLKGKSDTFDLIQISPSNIFGPASTVVQGLNEDYRYTEEAFQELYNHLSPQGLLNITLFLHPPPREELRLFNILYSALEERGFSNPKKHIFIFRSWGTITFIVKKTEFVLSEIDRLKGFCRSLWFDVVYYHGINETELNKFNKFDKPIYHNSIISIIQPERREKFLKNYLFDVSSVTDNKPYFYHFFKWDRFYDLYKSMGDKWQPLVEGGYIVPIVFVQAFFASMVFILLPAFLAGRLKTLLGKRSEKPDFKVFKKGMGNYLAYFFLIGLGFMFIEVVIIQKFILLLDHPVYSFATVIFSFLMSAGVGSFVSGKYSRIRMLGINKIIYILCGMVLLFYLLLSWWEKVLFLPLITRQILAVLFIFPFGLLMGMPFPMGIKKLESFSPSSIPWAWCINGCASVLSSVLAILLAIRWGFHTVLFCALGSYILAAVILGNRDKLHYTLKD